MFKQSPLRSAVSSVVEAVESRCLRSATLSNGVVTIREGSGSDSVHVDMNHRGKISVTENGRTTTLNVTTIKRVVFFGNAGNDSFLMSNGQNLAFVLEAHGGSGNDTMRGHEGVDYLLGDSGNDVLYGFGGNDFIDGGSTGIDTYSGDADRLFGGSGDDGMSGADFGRIIVANGEAGNDEIFGSNGPDSIDGNGGNDRIFGLGGNDTLTGASGDDRVHGDDGDDVIGGGMEGNDTLEGGQGNDSIRDIFGTNIITDHWGINVIDVRDTSGPGDVDIIYAFYGTAGNTIRMNPWDLLNPA